MKPFIDIAETALEGLASTSDLGSVSGIAP